MTPRELVGVAEVPGGPPLRLVRHGGDFIIMLDRNELMSSRMSGSEKALGLMTLERLGAPDAARLLIGGYGMGFTLRAVLAELGPRGRVVVAELVPGIIEWARGPMQALAAGCLDDPRVEIRIEDVGETISAAPANYDAILLDVDNGPDGLTRDANDGLYTAGGLARARAALRPGGILAVWSAGADAAFTRRLKQAGFVVDEVRVRARENGKGPIHTIWFARA
ncbi:spermidine synthase [Rhizorhabdus dicambivorans]|uniref:Spermidine synthase n=1 Tax=Rhizorhabdus dicambivorans TaxID=1850238 RepID=A0A2A4FST4_9SPHN|nr:spermidine synthase [Rhizorhabdus dicambivorans]ATE64404.1 spermidine synthase [Rhizorhabdus dicambivorans]PCE41247.1 spermidine synthase [Rhizorhabdus dicambivorans]